VRLSSCCSAACGFVISALLCAAPVVCAQAQAAPENDKPWTATSQTSGAGGPLRTTESHTKSGNLNVDKQTVEVQGPDGRYQPYLDTETETVQVNATTIRKIVRTYGRDSDGRRNLTQVTEDESQSSANGDGKVVRTTSNPDLNGGLQLVQREVSDTRKTGPNTEETKTTVYMPQSGSMAAVQQTVESQRHTGGGNVDVKKTTLLPDGNGEFQVGEVRENTIREEGKNRTSEERVSHPDSEGRLSEVSRTVGKETESAAGEKNNTVETYSTDAPGLAPDGSLHLNQRVTTVQKKDSSGKTTEQQVEQPNSGDPNAGLQVSTKTKYIVLYGASGTQQTKTIQAHDINGTFSVVSVETKKSDQAPAAQVQIAPSDKPK